MPQFHFGSGTLWGVQTLSGLGAVIANPTPRAFGTLQDVSVDASWDTKELYGRKQFPDDIARGKGKITLKAKYANISGAMLNDLIIGQTNATGMTLVSNEEALSIPATPFQITPANAATFVLDLGVKFAATGKGLTRVAAAPTTGQYSVNTGTGVYTFAAADTLLGVLISYAYTSGSIGTKIIVANKLMGFQPKFKIMLSEDYQGGQTNLILLQCVAQKLGWATKLDDYLIPEFEAQAHADAAGNVFEFHTNEQGV